MNSCEMTRIKICGLSRECDIDWANEIMPEFIGFVFAPSSRRYVTPERALQLKSRLDYRIAAVGVFVDETQEKIAEIVRSGAVDIVQLHGSEDSSYITRLREHIGVPVIQAFQIRSDDDIRRAAQSDADIVLLDSGKGSGRTFDHSLINDIDRPYFLAGGLSPENVRDAVERLHPYAVDTSSGVETDGYKDRHKMKSFVDSVR